MDVVKVVRSFDLGGYADGYAGKRCWVWVNLPMVLKRRRGELLGELALAMKPMKMGWLPMRLREKLLRRRLDKAQAGMCDWLAEVWSQGDDAGERWTAAEVRTLQQAEPTLYQWMLRESVLLIDDWQGNKKK